MGIEHLNRQNITIKNHLVGQSVNHFSFSRSQLSSFEVQQPDLFLFFPPNSLQHMELSRFLSNTYLHLFFSQAIFSPPSLNKIHEVPGGLPVLSGLCGHRRDVGPQGRHHRGLVVPLPGLDLRGRRGLGQHGLRH